MKVDQIGDHPEYQNRDARITVLDKQNIETCFTLPTFACGVEEALKYDVEATMVSLHAFNLWLDEDWGFDRTRSQDCLRAHHLTGRFGQGGRRDRIRPRARRQDGDGAGACRRHRKRLGERE